MSAPAGGPLRVHTGQIHAGAQRSGELTGQMIRAFEGYGQQAGDSTDCWQSQAGDRFRSLCRQMDQELKALARSLAAYAPALEQIAAEYGRTEAEQLHQTSTLPEGVLEGEVP